MGTSVDIPKGLFERLQKHAIPFVDTTPVSVIERMVGYFETHSLKAGGEAEAAKTPASKDVGHAKREFDPNRPPDLFHTVVSGEFGGIHFSRWNDLVRIAHTQGFKKTSSFEELRKVTHAQMRNGQHTEDGYRHLPEIDISIQGVDANHAWNHALRLARYLKVPLSARIEWRYKTGAAYPGESGVLSWHP